MTIPEFERKSEFARRLGCSRQNVQKLAARGLPLAEDGMVIVAAALAWIRENVSQPGAGLVDAEIPSLAEAKVRLILAQAERAEMELVKAKGELVARDDARRAVRALMRTFRDHMLNFANRHGPGIAAEVGAPSAKLVGLLEARIRDALNDIADTPAPFGGAE